MNFTRILFSIASLSLSSGLITTCQLPDSSVDVRQVEDLVSHLRCLLVPQQPGIFLHSSVTAHTLTRFTEVLNSFAANSGTTSGSWSSGGRDRSHVALASVVGLCRLFVSPLRYVHALEMDSSDLTIQFSAFLIG